MEGLVRTLNGHRVTRVGNNRPSLVGLRSERPLADLNRARSRTGLACKAAVQLEVAPTASVPRQVPDHSIALQPLKLESTWAYGVPMRGSPSPLGPTFDKETGSINFAIVSNAARAMSLVLFTQEDLAAGRSTHEIALDPVLNRTGDVWHIRLPNMDPNLLYGYRVTGPHQSKGPNLDGHRCDETQVVIDPYAKAILSRRKYGELGPELEYEQAEVLGLAQTWPQAAAWLPQAEADFDWEGDKPLELPMQDLVVYEMHVRGFTQHYSSGVQAPGTYLGVIEKLDYLKDLGVTAIELLPVFEFNELEYYSPIPGSTDGAHRYNFWGYSTVNFMSPMSRYSFAVANGSGGTAMQHEFKLLVREAHKRGIEVILDVVFNHTAEGNEMGPTLSFRGLDNRVYYMLAPKGEYYNYSGCGNTFNCNEPRVREFIVDCLRYWVEEYHIDGFRFDLASIMTRAHSAWHPTTSIPATHGVNGAPVGGPAAAAGEGPLPPGAMAAAAANGVPNAGDSMALHSGGAIVDAAGIMTDGAGAPTGTPLADPPLVAAISEDPVLRKVKLIAEAWDCDGLNQVGAFPHYGGRWSEWNGTFRDTVRQFMKGTDGPWAGSFASALCGSPNIYANSHSSETDWWGSNAGKRWKGNRTPSASINFITAHDGFTLADVVAYNDKHNQANGEGNNDGESHNLSWNCGEEGETDKIAVNRLRQRQMRNLACALLLSHGVPMLQMGDEYGHSKAGNNNTYCHDSPLNWMDWEAVGRDSAGFLRFMRQLIHFRLSHSELRRNSYVSDNDIQWHGEAPFTPDWSDASRLVAYTINDGKGGGLYVAFNTGHTPRTLQLPHWPGRAWQPVVDTSKVAPYDFLAADEELSEEEVAQAQLAASMWVGSGYFSLLPWSCCVLESVPEAETAALRSKQKP